ncbi:sulfate transporter [Ascosphaera apis ARSEF 7405]|uniref:Sulfate transporter n=1 Tax=Ascosphaera apis ARSEF 7405 TaxID=392613 RepID=A0A167WDG5_9EURO|nr:sulfate transporter [Ascosphaera apis ARSEF 7405]
MALLSNIRRNHAYNLSTLKRQPLAELSGAVGDLGTFLPLAIALAMNRTVSLPATLVLSGFFNITTGVFFGIPLPVQPMKAVAAAAIANKFTPQEIAAAGIFVGGCVMVFSVTGLLKWFARMVPIPVVKGIQFGAGLSLVLSAGTNMKSVLHWTTPWFDNYLWVGAAFVGLLLANIYRRLSYGLILFIACVMIASVRISSENDTPQFALWKPTREDIVVPDAQAWKTGIVEAGLGQLPLTTLNSVLAVVYLAAELLPSLGSPSMTAVGYSVGLMNLIGCWFGAMPICHGSGGLAAQYHFGARSGASVIMLGLFKIIIGVLFGETILSLLYKFPTSFLGIMVIAAGLQLASVGESLNTEKAWDLAERQQRNPANGLPTTRGQVQPLIKDDERRERWNVMLATMSMLLAFKNDGIGFLAGMTCHWAYQISGIIDMMNRYLEQGRIRLEANQDNRQTEP